MAKRMTETSKWKNQRWFRLLPPYYKLAWEYLHAVCDTDGTWLINVPDLIEDLKIPPPFSLLEFVKSCNTDYDNMTGEPIERQRIMFIGKAHILLTGYLHLQYEENQFYTINPKGNFARSALYKLASKGALWEALRRGYILLANPFISLLDGMAMTPGTVLDKEIEIDKEKDKDIMDKLDSDEAGKKTAKGTGAGARNLRVILPADETPEGTPPADPVPLPEMDQSAFAQYKAQLIEDHMFVDPLMAGYHLTQATLLPWVDIFNAHIVGEKNTKKDYDEYRKHFKRWLAKQDYTKPAPALPVKNGTPRIATGSTVALKTKDDLKKYEKTNV
jgi:hypothetical protein